MQVAVAFAISYAGLQSIPLLTCEASDRFLQFRTNQNNFEAVILRHCSFRTATLYFEYLLKAIALELELPVSLFTVQNNGFCVRLISPGFFFRRLSCFEKIDTVTVKKVVKLLLLSSFIRSCTTKLHAKPKVFKYINAEVCGFRKSGRTTTIEHIVLNGSDLHLR